jgi:hypothetical protein
MSEHECDTYAGTILALISEMFGPTHWLMYKQYTLDILQASPTAAQSADALVQLIQSRAGVVLLHNDLALETHSGRTTDLPCLDIPLNVPAYVVEGYFELCQMHFGAAAHIDSLVRDVEMMDTSGTEQDRGPAEVARCDAISFLSEQSRPTPQTQMAMDTLLDAMASLGL